MTTVIFVQHSGERHAVAASAGESVMQAAVNQMVPGILGDCGGTCSCATCHAYVDPAWQSLLPAPSEDEAMMLDGVLEQRPTSRLTCQVMLSAAMDGIVFQLPVRQC